VEEDHEVIAIGGTVHLGLRAGPRLQNQVKDELFGEIFKRHPTQNFHWLGGSSKIILKYPFFSADSSGWLQGRKKNQIYYFDENNDISTTLKNDWSFEQCISYNVSTLSLLEEFYEPIQLTLDMQIA